MIPDSEIRQYLIYGPKTGEFLWTKKSGQRGQIGTVAGTLTRGYRQIKFRGTLYKAHQLAWWWVHGEMPKGDIDHKNLDRDDNAILNLRLASRSNNMGNVRAYRNNMSGFKGITKTRTGRFIARVYVRGSALYLGTYDDPEDAARAYDVAAKAAFGEFARLNFPASEAAMEQWLAAQGATGGSGGYLSAGGK